MQITSLASLALDGAEAVTLGAEEMPAFIDWVAKEFAEAMLEAEIDA